MPIQMPPSRALCLPLLLLAPLPVQADALGMEAGVGSWAMEPSGTLNYRGTDADIENDLHLDDTANVFAWIAFEHPAPGLPNVKLKYARVDTDGNGSVARTFQFGNQTFSINEQISSDLTFDQGDVILYYEVLDNTVSLDIGLDLKIIDGEATLVSTLGREATDFTGALPLLYGAARIDLPLTGLSAALEASTLSHSGSRITDLDASLRYRITPGFAVQGGWKQQDLVLDDIDGFDSDIKLQGAYVAVVLDF